MTVLAPGRDLWSRLARDDRPVCGVEHEFTVSAAGAAVDFRTVVDGLGLGRRLDPGDPHAHRGAWGGVVTADGAEAEVVTPPVPVGPGAADLVHAYASAGRRFLAGRLPVGHVLTGYSTHLSTAVPDAVVRRTAALVVRHFSPALMLLLDRRSSPGLLVRPRPGRLEVCGEHVTGPALRQALAVVVAAAETCAAAAGSRRARGLLPPRLSLRTERAAVRYGTYVDRRAFGPDLYAEGRSAVLRARGGRITAGEHLALVVGLLGDRLRELLADDDLAGLHAVVAGDRPLPLEGDEPPDDEPVDDDPRCATDPLDLRPRRVGDVDVEVVSATWWTTVLRLTGGARTRWLTVPAPWLRSMLDSLDRGELDDAVAELTCG